jgi:hypothetical protein
LVVGIAEEVERLRREGHAPDEEPTATTTRRR